MKYIHRMCEQDEIDSFKPHIYSSTLLGIILDFENYLYIVRDAFEHFSDSCVGEYWVSDDMTWHTICHDVEHYSVEQYMDHHSNKSIVKYDDVVHLFLNWIVLYYKYDKPISQSYQEYKDQKPIVDDYVYRDLNVF